VCALQVRKRDFDLAPKKSVIKPHPGQLPEAVAPDANIESIVKRLDDLTLSVAIITKFVEEQT
jgi:hypothetical protein